tara:strand:+ start:404 stop:754 length:351 start_codon:yes stop_codon:yes gene_type:complete
MFTAVKKLCTPARIYFVLSMLSLVSLIFNNTFYGKEHKLCLGNYECPMENVMVVYIVKMGYVLFWSYLLNLLCKYGYKTISWLIVLMPVIGFFVALFSFMFYKNASVTVIDVQELQ